MNKIGLISSIGFSPEPIIVSIREIAKSHPIDEYAFIITKEVRGVVASVRKCLDLPEDRISYIEVNGMDPMEIFSKLRSHWNARPEFSFIMDITGGKKTMVGALTSFATIYDIRMLYVEGEYDPVVRKTIDGTEKVMELPNPQSEIWDVEAGLFKKLFTSGNYAAAASKAIEMKGRAADTRVWDISHKIALMFLQLEGLEFARSLSSAEHVRTMQTQYKTEIVPTPFLNTFIDLLEPLRDISSSIELERSFLGNPNVLGVLVAALLHSAERKCADGLYTDGALRYYRIIELLSQARLWNYGINTHEFDVENHVKGDTKDRIWAIREALDLENRDFRSTVGLYDGYLLLYGKRDELVPDSIVRELYPLLDIRNSSFLAHGLTNITKKRCDTFAKFTKNIINRFLQDSPTHIDSLSPNSFELSM